MTLSQAPDSRVEVLGRSIAKYAAIITAVVSAAVPATEYIRGFSNQKIKETEQRTTLAVTYLDRIAAKESNAPIASCISAHWRNSTAIRCRNGPRSS